jgi:hypothetical protein
MSALEIHIIETLVVYLLRITLIQGQMDQVALAIVRWKETYLVKSKTKINL